MPLRRRFLAAIPAQVRVRLARVERALGREVRLGIDRTLTRSPAKASSDGSISFSPAFAANLLRDNGQIDNDSMGVCAEEVLHLGRWADAYPVIEPLVRARLFDYAVPLSGLSGFFEESAFFPVLEGLGLNPREPITRSIEASGNVLLARLDEIERDDATEYWTVVLASLYVQVSEMAPPSQIKTELLQMFEHDALAP
jgi:hypothetical protein